MGGQSKLGTNAICVILSIPTKIHEISSYLDSSSRFHISRMVPNIYEVGLFLNYLLLQPPRHGWSKVSEKSQKKTEKYDNSTC